MSSIRRVPPPPPPGFGDDEYYRFYGTPEEYYQNRKNFELLQKERSTFKRIQNCDVADYESTYRSNGKSYNEQFKKHRGINCDTVSLSSYPFAELEDGEEPDYISEIVDSKDVLKSSRYENFRVTITNESDGTPSLSGMDEVADQSEFEPVSDEEQPIMPVKARRKRSNQMLDVKQKKTTGVSSSTKKMRTEKNSKIIESRPKRNNYVRHDDIIVVNESISSSSSSSSSPRSGRVSKKVREKAAQNRHRVNTSEKGRKTDVKSPSRNIDNRNQTKSSQQYLDRKHDSKTNSRNNRKSHAKLRRCNSRRSSSRSSTDSDLRREKRKPSPRRQRQRSPLRSSFRSRNTAHFNSRRNSLLDRCNSREYRRQNLRTRQRGLESDRNEYNSRSRIMLSRSPVQRRHGTRDYRRQNISRWKHDKFNNSDVVELDEIHRSQGESHWNRIKSERKKENDRCTGNRQQKIKRSNVSRSLSRKRDYSSSRTSSMSYSSYTSSSFSSSSFSSSSIHSEPVYSHTSVIAKSRRMDRQKLQRKNISSTDNIEVIDLDSSGKLAEESNIVNGVTVKYREPVEARKPRTKWRLYVFKGEEELPILYIHRQSVYLLGRDRKVCDIPLDHPSCSKQHAALQYRKVNYRCKKSDAMGQRVRPYIMDLNSANGTFLNNRRIDSRIFVELLEKDVLKFGFSSREYVILHDQNNDKEHEDSGVSD